MSTKPYNKEHDASQGARHADVSFEPQDIKVASIYRYLGALAATTVLALLICIYILRFTSAFVASTDTPPPQSREILGKDFKTLPPEPRLQGVPGHITDPQQDLRNKIEADSEANERLGWVDKQAGVAQIPVKDAMRIIAEKGLNAANPPAEGK
jgi:hypothetical protein